MTVFSRRVPNISILGVFICLKDQLVLPVNNSAFVESEAVFIVFFGIALGYTR